MKRRKKKWKRMRRRRRGSRRRKWLKVVENSKKYLKSKIIASESGDKTKKQTERLE